MNIVEAYIKFFNGLVILLSGLSGSNKTAIAKFIERDFKIHLINIEQYTKQDYNKLVELNNGVKVIDWDDIDSFDWDKINEDIKKYKSTGVIICGPYFPSDCIKHEVNYHIQIKISKQILINKRYDYVVSHQDKFKFPKGFNHQLIVNLVNQITYPRMVEYVQKSKIDKFINTIEKNDNQAQPTQSEIKSEEKIYKEITDFLFYKISERLKYRDTDPSNVKFSNTENTDKRLELMSPIDITDEWEQSTNRNKLLRQKKKKKYVYDTTISKTAPNYEVDDTTSDSSNIPECSDSSGCDEPIFLGKYSAPINELIYDDLIDQMK